jgi:plasmid stability protein
LGDIIRYLRRFAVADILIRNLPDDVVAAIDTKARRAGLSRSEYIRRALSRERGDTEGQTSIEDLAAFADDFGDLDDPDVMRHAWS